MDGHGCRSALAVASKRSIKARILQIANASSERRMAKGRDAICRPDETQSVKDSVAAPKALWGAESPINSPTGCAYCSLSCRDGDRCFLRCPFLPTSATDRFLITALVRHRANIVLAGHEIYFFRSGNTISCIRQPCALFSRAQACSARRINSSPGRDQLGRWFTVPRMSGSSRERNQGARNLWLNLVPNLLVIVYVCRVTIRSTGIFFVLLRTDVGAFLHCVQTRNHRRRAIAIARAVKAFPVLAIVYRFIAVTGQQQPVLS